MNGQNISKLFEPIKLNNIILSNRIAMAPMTRSRAIGNLPNALVETYYQQRASAGLIITEGVSPSPNGIGYARTPGIYSQQQIAAWTPVATAVHKENGKIFMQLMHVGRISHPANMPEGGVMLAPSAVTAKGDMWTDSEGMKPLGTPQAMTLQDIEHVIAEFVQASENAIAAGFDGVELHSANGYLLEQFLNPYSNTRTDKYGGSIANRTRFLLELVKAIGDKIGVEKVAVRISPYGMFNDMPAYDETFATYDTLSAELNKLGIAYLHVLAISARNTPEGLSLIDTIRKNFKGMLMLNGGYNLETANEAIASGLADTISFGVPFIANPDLPHRLLNNIPLSQPDANLFYAAGQEGYVDYATA